MTRSTIALAAVGLLAALAGPAVADDKAADVGASYKIPYHLTDTNHTLIRARINGKGPFNLVVDTGAPALYLGTEAAKRAGLAPAEGEFFATIDRLDFEGGAHLEKVQARVEDPFQLVGMNALGLPGATIDGLLGFNVLARFRIELDPTSDRMTWTRLDFEPPALEAPRREPGDPPQVELQLMGALGGLAKLAAVFIGKQPEDVLVPRGSIGLELVEATGPGGGLVVAGVLRGSPAEAAGVKPGDRLQQLAGKTVADLAAARAALADLRPDQPVALIVARGDQTLLLDLTASGGL